MMLLFVRLSNFLGSGGRSVVISPPLSSVGEASYLIEYVHVKFIIICQLTKFCERKDGFFLRLSDIKLFSTFLLVE